MESNIIGSNSFSWADVDWSMLRRLRARFLQFDECKAEPDGGTVQPDRSDYWKSGIELASYDFTFGERIGWKWDSVLAELKARGWIPPSGTILDWGCGTGIAGRRVIEAWPQAFRKLWLWDRSDAARSHAAERARTAFARMDVGSANQASVPDLLVISHVINELPPESFERLIALARQAQAVLWVEPGTMAGSRKLIEVRERMRGHFHAIAPCTHGAECGMLTSLNQRHWCHHFAKIPGFVHSDPGWGRFSAALEIDLSTLPYSYLVLDRRTAGPQVAGDDSRMIGRPRIYKGFTKVLSCQRDGVLDLTVQKRDAPVLVKELRKDPGSLYHWVRDADKIKDGEKLF